MGKVNKKRKQIICDLKSIAIAGIVVIGLLSLTLIHNAFANEIAFRAVEKAWQKIHLHKTPIVIQTPNNPSYKTSAITSNWFSNLAYGINQNAKIIDQFTATGVSTIRNFL